MVVRLGLERVVSGTVSLVEVGRAVSQVLTVVVFEVSGVVAVVASGIGALLLHGKALLLIGMQIVQDDVVILPMISMKMKRSKDVFATGMSF